MWELVAFGLGILSLTDQCKGGVVSSRTTTDSPEDYQSWTSITLWPADIIPYKINEQEYAADKLGMIYAAMKRWEYKTCVQFVPWTEDMGGAYVNVYSAGSCFSRPGKDDRQPQLLGLGKGCLNMFTMVHELGHAIGLVHEMERVDRDMYIDVMYDNINPASVRNFHTTDMKNVLYSLYNTPYDYKSIMHYSPKYWSSNKLPTVVPRDPAYYHVIGRGNDVSFFDALYVNRAYGCSARCSASLLDACKNGGFLGGPDCRCICQDGYGGQFCDQTIPGNEHVLQWTCQKGWQYHEGQCYKATTDGGTGFHAASSLCKLARADLVVFRDRPETQWLNHYIREQRLITGVSKFWVGVYKASGQTDVTWIADDTPVDTNIVSVSSGVGVGEEGCGVFDGETVTLTPCQGQTDIGYLCEKEHDASCGGRYIVTSVPTSIQTPNFPGSYPSDLTCTYILQTSEGSRINITFDSQSKLDSSTGCTRDYVSVMLSIDVTQAGTRYCGTDLQDQQFTSDGNLAVITFRSNARMQFSGFRATLVEIKQAGHVTTTESFLGMIRNALFKTSDGTGEDAAQAQHDAEVVQWNLSAFFKMMKSMTFSKLF